MLAIFTPDASTAGLVVGLLEPDGRRRVIACGAQCADGAPLDGRTADVTAFLLREERRKFDRRR